MRRAAAARTPRSVPLRPPEFHACEISFCNFLGGLSTRFAVQDESQNTRKFSPFEVFAGSNRMFSALLYFTLQSCTNSRLMGSCDKPFRIASEQEVVALGIRRRATLRPDFRVRVKIANEYIVTRIISNCDVQCSVSRFDAL